MLLCYHQTSLFVLQLSVFDIHSFLLTFEETFNFFLFHSKTFFVFLLFILQFVSRIESVVKPLSKMEQHTLKNVNNCMNTNIDSYLETSGGQSSNPYLNVVLFFNTRVIRNLFSCIVVLYVLSY